MAARLSSRARRSRRSARTLGLRLERLEDRLALSEGATFVDDSWQLLFDVDFSFSLTSGDLVTNGTVAGAYGVNAFGRVTSGPFQGSLPGMATINDAINATNAGGIVFIEAGTYAENVNITKSLTLKGNALSGRTGVVIDAPGRFESGIDVIAGTGNVVILDLRVTGSNVGVHGQSAASITLLNVQVDGNTTGVLMKGLACDVTLSGVVADNNFGFGAYIRLADTVTIGDHSSFSGNGSVDSVTPRGLYIEEVTGPVRLTDVTANNNTHGGIHFFNLRSDATLLRVTANNNDTDNDGSGDGLQVRAGASTSVGGFEEFW